MQSWKFWWGIKKTAEAVFFIHRTSGTTLTLSLWREIPEFLRQAISYLQQTPGKHHRRWTRKRFCQPDSIYQWRPTCRRHPPPRDRKSTRLNSSHVAISYAVFCLKKKKPKDAQQNKQPPNHQPHQV